MIPRDLPRRRSRSATRPGTDEEKHAGADGVKRHVRADAAIVTGPNVDYVIAIYARQVEDTRWGVDNDALVTGAQVSRMVFEHFSRAGSSDARAASEQRALHAFVIEQPALAIEAAAVARSGCRCCR